MGDGSKWGAGSAALAGATDPADKGWEELRLGKAFVAACEALLGASLHSVSSGVAACAASGSAGCMRMALARLRSEGGLSQRDVALCLGRASRHGGGPEVLALAMSAAEPGAGAWALREAMLAREWGKLRDLLALGADMDASPRMPSIRNFQALLWADLKAGTARQVMRAMESGGPLSWMDGGAGILRGDAEAAPQLERFMIDLAVRDAVGPTSPRAPAPRL